MSGYLVLQGWTTYRASHVQRHHPQLGIPGRDPDLDVHLEEGLYRWQGTRQFIWRNVVAPLFLLRTPAKLRDLLVNRMWSRAEPLRETLLRSTWIALLIGTCVCFGWGQELVLFWVVPLTVTFPIFSWWIELMEHYPLMSGSATNLEMSRNRWTGPLGRFLTGAHCEHLHQVHHVFPRVPFWNLRRAHEILMEDSLYAATQTRSVGLLRPVVPGIPTILESVARKPAKRSSRPAEWKRSASVPLALAASSRRPSIRTSRVRLRRSWNRTLGGTRSRHCGGP